MHDVGSYLDTQYKLIQQSRAIIFEFCKTISADDFVNQNNSFGRGGSIRNLLVHVVNAYEFWILNNALNKNIINTEYSTISTVSEIETLYLSIDDGILEFIHQYKSTIYETMDLNIDRVDHEVSPLELFTHVTTHEFHHKGQILSLSRHLGYTPIDSDIIRF